MLIRKLALSLIVFTVVLLTIPLKVFASTDADYAWVLDEMLDFEYADRWIKLDEHPSYAVSNTYAHGVYSASTSYTGDDPNGQGFKGTLGLRAEFSGMPQVIYPDKPVTLNFSFSATENSVVKLSFSGWASADFDQWDVGAGSRTGGSIPFKNSKDEDSFTINAINGPTSYTETLTATLGKGSDDSRIALRTIFSMGAPMGTNYVYVWKQVSDKQDDAKIDPNAPYIPKKKPHVPIEQRADFWARWEKQAKAWTQEDIDYAMKTTRIVKVGDIHGEAWVLRGWDTDIDDAVYLQMGMELRHGDLIITRKDSGVILSYSDMSTYIMGADTEIVLDFPEDKTTKIGIVAGRIWTNLKHMVEDGTMEIEMAQAVSGIKGTTLICEEDGATSILKVIEGEVELTSKITGAMVTVKSGQMIYVTAEEMSEVFTFDIDAELATWDDEVRVLSDKAIAESEGGLNLWMIIGGTAIGLSLAAGAFIFMRVKKPVLVK